MSSPNYPGHYAHGRRCHWIIRVAPTQRISLTFVDLDIYQRRLPIRYPIFCYDHVKVRSTRQTVAVNYYSVPIPTSFPQFLPSHLHPHRPRPAPSPATLFIPASPHPDWRQNDVLQMQRSYSNIFLTCRNFAT